MSEKKEHRVLMTKRLARRWVLQHITPESRITVYYGADVSITMPDLGVKERFDAFEVWSSDKESMVVLNKWLEDRGFQTSGVW